jgi:hypothetical protein
MQKRLLYIFVFVLTSCSLLAQDIEFTASAPKYVREGEQFQVQFTLNKNVEDFTPPEFEGFDFLDGPMQSTSQSTLYENGKLTRISTISFIYYLRAKKAGTYTLNPAKAVYKKNEVSSNSVTIEVVGNSQQQSSGQQNGASAQQNQSSPTTTEAPGNDIFVSLVLDKKNAYIGEQITAYIKIYTKVNLAGIDGQATKFPEFTGFFKQEVETPPLTNLTQEKVGNDIYYSGVLKKFVIFPQKSGAVTIDPFNLTVFVQKQVRQSRSIFDDFFGQSYSNVPVKLTSKPVTINVKALPEPQPDRYSGAVGQFSIAASLNTNKVRQNDAVTFRVSVSGKGNIKLIENVKSEIPATFEVYDPVVKSSIDNSGTSGSKVFEITAIPRSSGTFEIKPFSLVYFDPSTQSYKTIQTQAFTLEVEKGEGDSSSVIVSNMSKEDVELLTSDIRFIKTSAKFTRFYHYLTDSFWYYLMFIICILLLAFVFVFKKEQIRRNADITSTKHRKASKLANRRFKVARVELNNNNFDKFYEELSKALWGYLSDKLRIPVSLLSADSAKEALETKGISADIIEGYLGIISHCEFARYAKGATDKTPVEIYDEAVKVLLTIDQKL